MKYTPQEVMQYIQEEDVKFIRLAFCDSLGRPKNISIMPQELERAFKYGIALDASAIAGFGDEIHSDLFLHPDPATITVAAEKAQHWIKNGAQPTDTVRGLLKSAGVL